MTQDLRDILAMAASEADIEAHRGGRFLDVGPKSGNIGIASSYRHYDHTREQARYRFADAMIKAMRQKDGLMTKNTDMIDAALELRQFFGYRKIEESWVEDGFMDLLAHFDKVLIESLPDGFERKVYPKRPNTYVIKKFREDV